MTIEYDQTSLRTPVRGKVAAIGYAGEDKENAMEDPIHPLRELFSQLGLDSDAQSIEGFIVRHAPLDEAVKLDQAPFWSSQQALFLGEALRDDADWAPVVDQLNVLLRKRPD